MRVVVKIISANESHSAERADEDLGRYTQRNISAFVKAAALCAAYQRILRLLSAVRGADDIHLLRQVCCALTSFYFPSDLSILQNSLISPSLSSSSPKVRRQLAQPV